MSEQKKVIVKGTSPVGNANWFKLVKPDAKFQKYSVDLIVEDSPELQQLINKMDEMVAETVVEAKGKAKDANAAKKIIDSQSRPVEPQLDSEGKETGKYIMKFRAAASGKKKDSTIYTIPAPQVFDAKAKPITGAAKESLQVPNGSLIRVSYELSPYALATGSCGVTLKPKAAMIIKSQSVQDASQFGFSASEFAEQDDSDSEDFSAEANVVSESTGSDDF